MVEPANYPDIFLTDLDTNPTLVSPNATYTLPFALTKERSYDYEEYNAVLMAAIKEFRRSRTYTKYKGYLYNLGLNCCAFHPYIQNLDELEVATLEMHHCMLTIYDIAFIIAEHFLNTIGTITEFDISELLRYEHTHNRIPIVFLCKDCHKRYHKQYLYVHPDNIFGKWWELIERYKMGITRDIAFKLLMYLNKSIGTKWDYQNERNKKLLALRDSLESFANTGTTSITPLQ